MGADNNPSAPSPGLQPQFASFVPQKRPGEPQGSRFRQKTKVTRACDVCKAKKSKCTGEQPCESCSHRGLACTYDAHYSRGRPPPPVTASSRSPSASQVSSSEQFILESSHRHISANSSRHTQSTERAVNNLLSSSAISREDGREAMQDAPSRASPELEVAGQFSDPTSALSFLHRAWRRISNNENSQVVTGQVGTHEDGQLLASAGDKPFQKPNVIRMPSRDRGHALLELYFDVCIATYRILHRPSVEAWSSVVMTNAELNQPLPHGIGTSRAAVVLSVLAVASFHEEKAHGGDNLSPESPEGGHSSSPADDLFSEASRLSERETGLPRLESAQSRLIQVLYLLMSCRFNQAWYTFGHALQIISALGLHRREDRKRTSMTQKRDYIENQCKRRTFWVAYTLDKYLGVIFGRPRHYHDDDIDQDFPDSVNDEDMYSSGPQAEGSDSDCHIDSLICHARLAQIAEKISREVYSIKPIPDHVRLAASHRLGAELRKWRTSLPPFLGAINPSSLILSFRRQATALKLAYCHAVMLAHRPFLLKNNFRNNEEMRALAQESLVECISAAQSVLETVDRMAREGRLFHAFWWTHYVCFCALVIVYVWAIQESGNRATVEERRKVLDQAERCLSHLAQATATNSPSRKYSIILQELRAEAKRKTARPVQEQSNLPQSSVAHATTGVSHLGAFDTSSSVIRDPVQQIWQPLFGSPIDTATPGLQNFLDDWQTTDWLHLDSSAFGPFPESEGASVTWM